MADEQGGSSRGGKKGTTFRSHLAVYVVFSIFFFVLNMLTGAGDLWFYWPMLGWGLGLALHAIATYGADAPAEVVSTLKSWLGRLATPTAPPPPPSPFGSRDSARQAPPRTEDRTAAGLHELIAGGETKVDAMRAQARRIGKPDVRDRALAICASADRILGALNEVPSERQLARDFVERYLTPAEAIVTRYARLSNRGVSPAEPTLLKVETEDLPLLDAKMRELYDRLHRGDVIDLEVAREMLTLDFADAGTEPAPPARRPNDRRGTPV